MKNSNDTIGNRTRDLLACRAGPQPTEPPRTPYIYIYISDPDPLLSSSCQSVQLNNRLQQGPQELLLPHNFSASHEIPYFYENRIFSIVLTTVQHLTVSRMSVRFPVFF